MLTRSLFKIVTLCMFAGIFLAGCASTPDTYSSVAPGSDLSNIKTYGFISEASTNKAGYESLETNFLKVAVAQQLDLRGLRYEPSNPDVLMNFFINTDDKIRARQTPTMSGGYYGYRGDMYDDWGGGGVAYETRIDQYTMGTLTIDMIDAKQRKLIWEGTVTGRITKKDVRNLEATIDEAVKDVFVKFPALGASN